MARRKKNEEEPNENQDNLNNDSDDTFGLPEVHYEPLKRDQPEPPAETPSEPVEEPVVNPEPPLAAEPVEEPVFERPYETREEPETIHYEERVRHEEETHDYSGGYHYEPERPSPWPKILGIAALVLLVLGAIYYFGMYQPEQKKIAAAERERAEKLAAERDRKDRERKAAADLAKAADERRLDSLANIPKEGTLEVLSGRTGQYYVVVASAIDDDLLTDYASKLVSQGKSVKIIPPFGKKGRFYRLAIDSKGSYDEAQALADGMKGGDFGDQLWVVRY